MLRSRSLLGDVFGAAFMVCVLTGLGACPLGYVAPDWVWMCAEVYLRELGASLVLGLLLLVGLRPFGSLAIEVGSGLLARPWR